MLMLRRRAGAEPQQGFAVAEQRPSGPVPSITACPRSRWHPPKAPSARAPLASTALAASQQQSMRSPSSHSAAARQEPPFWSLLLNASQRDIGRIRETRAQCVAVPCKNLS
jgi:hypothetical protein